MYKIYTDKNENFECEVSVKNASLKGSIARLVVESNEGTNLVFNGNIKDGRCNVPIHKVKGLLDENTKGKMYLEVIVEDTYFKPWQSEFLVEEHTSVKVKINESKESTKPSVQVKVPSNQKGINIWVPLHEISKICEKIGINKSNINSRKGDFIQLISEYFNSNPEFKKDKNTILNGLKHFLK